MGGIRVALLLCLLTFVACQYQPTWDSLDARPLPTWFDEAKFGIFIHWGVFSVPSFGSEWFWWYWQGEKDKAYVDFMNNNFPPGFTYADFASMFTAEMYNATQWAQILANSGAKYVVLTSKHHEGFTNWPSNYSWNWNAGDVGPRRDLVGELTNAVRSTTSMRMGLYHSMFEWFNPLYLRDRDNNFTTTDFVDHKTMPELYELVQKYKPEIIWSDGDAGPDTYWKSKEFLAWLYNDSPVKDTVVVNDRWGDGDACTHGGYFTCGDRWQPGKLLPRKWENCMTIDRASWGFRRNAVLADYLSTHDLVSTLAQTVAYGGNLLMNIGPTHDGRIDPIFEERLSQMGSWLSVNGESIYGTVPWKQQNDTYYSTLWYTAKGAYVYAIVMNWPQSDYLDLACPQPTPSTTVNLLGMGGNLEWAKRAEGGIRVFVSQVPVEEMLDYAWVFRLYKVMPPSGKGREKSRQ